MIQRYRSSEKDREPRVDIWKKPKKVLYTERALGKTFLQVSIEIKQPVLTDGREGFFQLSTQIKSNDHYIRLTPTAIIELMDILANNREKILDAVAYVREENEIMRESEQERPRRRRY
jgi:hypothetical protein